MIEIGKREFHLKGKTFSYRMRVNEAGYLEHLHFGGRMGGEDLAVLTEPFGLAFAATPPGAAAPFSLDLMDGEVGSYGQGDFRTPSVVVSRADGAFSRYLYEDSRLTEDSPHGLPMPHGGQTLAVTLWDACSPLKLILYYTVFDDCDVLVRSLEIVNCGENAVDIRRAYSFSLDLPAGKYEALRLHGRHCAEGIPERSVLGHGCLKLRSSRGASSPQCNPFLALGEGAGEETGSVYGVMLLYSGSWAIEAEQSQTDGVRLTGGISDENFCFRLGPGERFRTPRAALAYSSCGYGGLSRTLADFLRAHLVPEEALRPRPIVVNSWEAVYFDFDEGRILRLIDDAADLGADIFVLDDGWFGRRNDDTSGLGDWFVNTEKLRRGLKPLSDRCRERGIGFGLWFEPEMVSRDSDLFRAHPDWAVGHGDGCLSRNQFVLDLTRREVVDEIFSRMAKVIGENGVGYVKWDMNRHITEGVSSAAPERAGEFFHRYLLGVYDLAARLKAAFPNVFFEGCSSGGGRFDAGMLAYFPQIWTSDDTDAYERAKIQWGMSYAYPMSAMSCHVSACPNHQTGRTTPLSSRGNMALLGALGYELDPGTLTKREKEEIAAQIAESRAREELMLRGDLYRLIDPFEDEYFAVGLVSKDKAQAVVTGMQTLAMPACFYRRLRLRGLDENRAYRVRELNATFLGSTLMNAGLRLPRTGDFGTWVWHLEVESIRRGRK